QCFADVAAIAISSGAASNALINDGKTELLHSGRPRLTLPFAPSLEPVRYLGIFFTEQGIATGHMQPIFISRIETQIAGWHDRKLSLMGRALLCNSTLLDLSA
ncbi:hypothetical protein IWQ57_005856, partial [Coemansia nantahalensis]